MIKLGKKNECFGTENLRTLDICGKPRSMPDLNEGESLICEIDLGIYQDLYVAENMNDIEQLYDSYASGCALGINWFAGEDPGFISIL